MSKFTKNASRFDPYKNFKFRVTFALPESADEEQVVDLDRFAGLLDPAAAVGALFVGAKGTGKTMAAEVVANQLAVPFHRVDLSTVVSEYIGETEKNIRRIFDAAEESGALLFFDEADALFGKRSEVKDAHDRYANLEVGYFVERLESYPGLTILATGIKENIDSGFLRRIRFMVDFPKPDPEEK